MDFATPAQINTIRSPCAQLGYDPDDYMDGLTKAAASELIREMLEEL